MTYKVHVLENGYSSLNEDGSMSACGTCTLIKGENVNMVVDTLSPWDKDILVDSLAKFNLSPSDVTHLVCTHGHPDHIGNNNLFTAAKLHIVGHSIHHRNEYYPHGFEEGKCYEIDGENLYVLPTPGHTLDSISVIVKTEDGCTVCVAGDLFEKESDLKDASLWKEAGSEDEVAQVRNRTKVLLLSDFIIPGHGPMFAVTQEMKADARSMQKNS